LLPGDRIAAVNGSKVRSYWELEEIVGNTFAPAVTALAERVAPTSKKVKLIESRIRMGLYPGIPHNESEAGFGHIYSVVPRLRIEAVSKGPASIGERLNSLLRKVGLKEKMDRGPGFQDGDIVLAIGDVENPTYEEFREVTTRYEAKELPIEVLRVGADGTEQRVTITLVPKRAKGDNRVVIGIFLVTAFDAEHPVVAKTIATESGPPALAIPRGAVITAVGGVEVSNYYDIIREIRRHSGVTVAINYVLEEGTGGTAVLDLREAKDYVTVQARLAEVVPFEPLERLYKAGGPFDAIGMGYRKTVMFVAQAYLTLKRFVSGLVSAKEFMGPVGIVTISYRIVSERPLIYYVYFLALINAFIAALNSLPILPFDGGHILFLLIEKSKGSPVSERIQGAIAYAGWVVVGALALYVTFNDIVRSFFS
jgi:RIP metalloprotease RseP